jgi:serine/threonine protein kinase
LLCYRCGSHVADTSESCPNCGQKLAGGGVRQATATFSRRRATTGTMEGAPYKPGDVVSGRYLIKDIVGVGPLGFVFRGQDKEIDVEVALKVINAKLCQTADERKGFAKQMRTARKLSHPNLVRVYEEAEDQDRPFYTSQYLDGLTLRKIIDLRLQKGQFFSLREIEPILAQIASALDGAHKVGPHSDLKPENVLVLPDLLKVTDFGLGLAMPRLPFVQAMKARKADRYLSPELSEGREVDFRTDLYSMAVILGEMLSGLTPDGALPELQRRNPEVPQAIEGLYRKALSANPLARPKSANEFIAEFIEICRRVAPPPLKAKPESATGTPVARPRTTTGMLQLQPRRDKPPPPVPDMPPPPPISEEVEILSGAEEMPPDATQPVDSLQLKAALNGNYGNGANGANGKAEHEETEVIQSGQLLADAAALDEETRAGVATTREPDPDEDSGKSRTLMWLLILGVIGIGVGAVGGSILLKKIAPPPEPVPTVDDTAKRAEEARKADEARKVEELRVAAQRKAEEEAARAEAERIASERAAAEKAAAEAKKPPTAFEKAAADKAALAEKREAFAAEKAAKDKENAEKREAFAAEKAAKDKEAAEKREAAAAEKAAKDKEHPVAAQKTEKPAAVVATAAAAEGGPCPENMRMVPAGSFKMGTAADDPMRGFDEKALSSVEVGAFCVDQFEFPNKRGVSPTINVAFADAKRLCEGRGKRLCSEEEWEKSCKGPGNARWPYGNVFDANACNTEDEAGDDRLISPSGRFAKCRSGFGVADLSGNASEWTAEKIVKGGSFGRADFAVRCSARQAGTGGKSSEVGFRCCADPK